jgi:hypothetical protein
MCSVAQAAQRSVETNRVLLLLTTYLIDCFLQCGQEFSRMKTTAHRPHHDFHPTRKSERQRGIATDLRIASAHRVELAYSSCVDR